MGRGKQQSGCGTAVVEGFDYGIDREEHAIEHLCLGLIAASSRWPEICAKFPRP